MIFKKKYNQEAEIKPDPLIITCGEMKESAGSIPIVKISGILPSGSNGNETMSTCFLKVSREVDIQASPSRKLIYDMTGLRYDFGDHIGAFLWNLPALLDGVSIMVAATGSTRKNLESLSEFIGAWLPIAFFESLEQIAAQILEDSKIFGFLEEKRTRCSQKGQVIAAGDSGTEVVILGSRQTGYQYRTHLKPRQYSDIDCGVVGGPRELAILIEKMSNQPGLLKKVKHPPIKAYPSAQDAVSQGLCVILPERMSVYHDKRRSSHGKLS
jgi:hypothetical protein